MIVKQNDPWESFILRMRKLLQIAIVTHHVQLLNIATDIISLAPLVTNQTLACVGQRLVV